VVYRAAGRGEKLAFHDTSFPDRIGWRELTVSARDGGRVVASDVAPASTSDLLRTYPRDLLRSPLDVSSAVATVHFGIEPGPAPAISGIGAATHASRGFADLIERGDLSLGVLLISLLVASFWGAAHALTPGHGKAMVA